ncbi:MAG: glycoside hydrolase family 3 C-terminal domain-containing protein [Deferribacteraceae bacterium]|jgi:beta-glucosidase|nr:glycoside hydrolase family 3 C-terminal domain-containing protein [Deferribacteraceae bacterium]
MKMKRFIAAVAILAMAGCVSFGGSGSGKKETKTTDGHIIVTQSGGPTLGYSPDSGVKILDVDGKAFKDLNKNGSLDPYEDWRLSADERAKDLASKLTKEEIAGLMLYSAHQAVKGSELSEAQVKFLTEDNVRAVLLTTVSSKADAAKWNNAAQALVEKIGKGVPINASSDPRHAASSGEAYSAGVGDISTWPPNLGLAATFDPAIVRQFGEIASQEYRALGISTALSPQIDLATEPRWLRVSGTFGEDVGLATDMARAYVDGFQTSVAGTDGWGYTSVNAMIKHWPGDGAGENGRESHTFPGKYTVYPGNNYEAHFRPFTEGGLKLDGPTGSASALMSSYSIAFSKDGKYGELVGSGYSKAKIDILRNQYGFDGVICTDWLIGGGPISENYSFEKSGSFQPTIPQVFAGMGIPWGMEYDKTMAERFYKILESGHDQFGGVNTAVPVLAAYEIGVNTIGEEAMRARFEESAVRLLRNIFRPGLFENPYLDSAASEALVGRADFMQAGYDAQLASIVMLKNHNNIIKAASGKKTVYIPMKFTPAVMGLIAAEQRMEEVKPATIAPAVDLEAARKYFNVVTDTVNTVAGAKPKATDIVRLKDFSGVDYAIVGIGSPDFGGNFDSDIFRFDKLNRDPKRGKIDNGYYPIPLQYRPYTAANNAHNSTSISTDPYEEKAWIAAGGKPGTSRAYAGKTSVARNSYELDLLLDTKKAIGNVPMIVFVTAKNPLVFAEFEAAAAAIFVNFGVSDQAMMEVAAGQYEPKGLLPVQMPKDMAAVEANLEDVAGEMAVHRDVDGNTYDFAYGLNWSGKISDARTEKYGRK